MVKSLIPKYYDSSFYPVGIYSYFMIGLEMFYVFSVCALFFYKLSPCKWVTVTYMHFKNSTTGAECPGIISSIESLLRANASCCVRNDK
jgi:hypothetical protein